jgi:hypothetical protein
MTFRCSQKDRSRAPADLPPRLSVLGRHYSRYIGFREAESAQIPTLLNLQQPVQTSRIPGRIRRIVVVEVDKDPFCAACPDFLGPCA